MNDYFLSFVMICKDVVSFVIFLDLVENWSVKLLYTLGIANMILFDFFCKYKMMCFGVMCIVCLCVCFDSLFKLIVELDIVRSVFSFVGRYVS